jgi:hypothetical protein
MSAETEVQKALYLALAGIGLQVYDVAPQATDGGSNATFPYVEVGEIVLTEFDTASETGFDFVARIHTRSRSTSHAEAKTIQGQIYARLHRGPLVVDGFHFIQLDRESSRCDRVSDGSFHGVCEYRGLIETA